MLAYKQSFCVGDVFFFSVDREKLAEKTPTPRIETQRTNQKNSTITILSNERLLKQIAEKTKSTEIRILSLVETA